MVINGEIISRHHPIPAVVLIIAANQSEFDVQRVMWVLDRDTIGCWLSTGSAMTGHLADVITIARKWCNIAITFRQFDARAPHESGFEELATLHHRIGDHQAQRLVVEEWLQYWPKSRRRTNGARDRMVERLNHKCFQPARPKAFIAGWR